MEAPSKLGRWLGIGLALGLLDSAHRPGLGGSRVIVGQLEAPRGGHWIRDAGSIWIGGVSGLTSRGPGDRIAGRATAERVETDLSPGDCSWGGCAQPGHAEHAPGHIPARSGGGSL